MIEQTLVFRITQDTQAGGLRVGGEINLSSVLNGQNHGVIPQSLFGAPIVRRQELVFIDLVIIKEAISRLALSPNATGLGDGGRRSGGQLGGEDNQALGQTPVSQSSSAQLVLGPILAAILVQLDNYLILQLFLA